MSKRSVELLRQFVEDFGEKNAAACESAARYHSGGIPETEQSFEWALRVCADYCCPDYPGGPHHDFDISINEFSAWMKENFYV